MTRAPRPDDVPGKRARPSARGNRNNPLIMPTTMGPARLPLPLLLLVSLCTVGGVGVTAPRGALAAAHLTQPRPPPPDVCAGGPLVRLEVFAPDAVSGKDDEGAASVPFSTEWGVPAVGFGGLPGNATSPRPRRRLRIASPLTVCGEDGDGGNGGGSGSFSSSNDDGGGDLAGAVVLAKRGGGANCSFADKYDRLVGGAGGKGGGGGGMGAAGMLLFDSRPGCVVMGKSPPPAADDKKAGGSSDPSSADKYNAPPALSLDRDRGLALAELVREVEAVGGHVEVEAYVPDLSSALGAFGGAGAWASMAALAAMATATVAAGAAWSGLDRRRELRGLLAAEQAGAGGRRGRRRRAAGEAPDAYSSFLHVTPSGALGFVLAASLSLLALWLLRGPLLSLLITAAFAWGGAQGVAAWMAPLMRRALGAWGAGRVVKGAGAAAAVVVAMAGLQPPMEDDEEGGSGGWEALNAAEEEEEDGEQQQQQPTAPAPTPPPPPPPRRADALASLLALLLAAAWLAGEIALPFGGGGGGALSASWFSWLGQDVLACSLLVQLLRALRLPNLRAATALLLLALLYDVWWVFLEPRMFGGESVMVDVATGGGSAARPLPLLLRVPSPLFGRARLEAALRALLPGLPASIDPLGGARGESLLGFGDVALPGLLVALARRVDVEEEEGEEDGEGSAGAAAAPPRPPRFFPACVAGYACGLGLTFAALRLGVGGEGGQPALLYLSPSVLVAFALVATVRGELGQRWRDGDGSGEDGGGGGQRTDGARVAEA
jgi:hypothetical protein